MAERKQNKKPAAKKATAEQVHESKPSAEDLAAMREQVKQQAERAALLEINQICDKYKVAILGTFQIIGNQASNGWTVQAK